MLIGLILAIIFATLAKKKKISQVSIFFITLFNWLIGLITFFVVPKQKFKNDYKLLSRCKGWGIAFIILGSLQLIGVIYMTIRGYTSLSIAHYTSGLSWLVLGGWMVGNALPKGKDDGYIEMAEKKHAEEIAKKEEFMARARNANKLNGNTNPPAPTNNQVTPPPFPSDGQATPPQNN